MAHGKPKGSEFGRIGNIAGFQKKNTTVVTVNGEVKSKEDAPVYVKELDLFLAVKLFEDKPAVVSLGKLCEDQR